MLLLATCYNFALSMSFFCAPQSRLCAARADHSKIFKFLFTQSAFAAKFAQVFFAHRAWQNFPLGLVSLGIDTLTSAFFQDFSLRLVLCWNDKKRGMRDKENDRERLLSAVSECTYIWLTPHPSPPPSTLLPMNLRRQITNVLIWWEIAQLANLTFHPSSVSSYSANII